MQGRSTVFIVITAKPYRIKSLSFESLKIISPRNNFREYNANNDARTLFFFRII